MSDCSSDGTLLRLRFGFEAEPVIFAETKVLHPVLRENVQRRIDLSAAHKVDISAHEIEPLTNHIHPASDPVEGADHIYGTAGWLSCLKPALQLDLRFIRFYPVIAVNRDAKIDRQCHWTG
jgi:hypothetical protein